MRITIITFGSRGDMQPYVALGRGLQAANFDVTLATHNDYADFIRGYGLKFAPVGGSPRELLESEQGRRWLESSRNPVKFITRMRSIVDPLISEVLSLSMEACRDSDLILPSTLGLFSALPVAEKLKIPVVPVPLQPLVTSSYLTNSLFPVMQPWFPFKRPYNRFSYHSLQHLLWFLFGSAINQQRRDLFNLPPSSPAAWEKVKDIPVLHGYSEHVIPRPADWDENSYTCGYWFLDAPADFTPPPTLVDFLNDGPPPVYIGFGSMNTRDPEATAAMALDALRQSGQRGVLLTGWGGLKSSDLPANVYAIDNIPHDWLFPRMAAVVHHGGIGTTAAGLRAGVPSMVVPFFADQPFWAQRVYALGVGPRPVLRKHLTAARLADAIRIMVSDSAMRTQAALLGETLRAEDGVGNTVRLLQQLIAEGKLNTQWNTRIGV